MEKRGKPAFRAAQQFAGSKLAKQILRLPANARGALWLVLSGILFSAMAASVKLVGTRLDSFEIAFFRSLVALIALLPIVWRVGFGTLATKRPWAHLLRGVLGTTAMLCGFYALTHLPLATAIAIQFSRPLFLIVLAILILNETVGPRRLIATVIGFAGVLVMMRPSEGIDDAALVAVFGTMVVAGAVVLIKILTRTEKPLSLVFSFSLLSALFSAVPAALVWQTPTMTELGLMIGVGVLAMSAQFCYIRGYSIGEATAISPFDYFRLLFATIIGLTLFNETPDLWTLVGGLLIIVPTLYIARREAVLGRQ